MSDERIVIDIIQRFSNRNYRGAIQELTDIRNRLHTVSRAQTEQTETSRKQLRAMSALHPEIRKTAESLSRYARAIEHNDGLSRRQLQNFERQTQKLRDWSKGLSVAQREVYGLDRALEDLGDTHVKLNAQLDDSDKQTKRTGRSVRTLTNDLKDYSKRAREAGDFTELNTGAMRRFARQVDRYTATTGRRAINGWRAWGQTIATVLPSALPQLLSLTAQAVDGLSALVVEAAASFRSLAGGIGTVGAGISGILQIVGAFKLGLGQLGTTSQSIGKVIGASLSESGKDFLNVLKDLPPQAAKFAVQMRAQVFPIIHRWRQEFQGILLPALSAGFKNARPLLAPLHGALRGMAQAIGSTIRSVSRSLSTPAWQQFIRFQGNENVRNFRRLSTGIVPLANAFRQLTVAAAPVTRFLADAGASALRAFGRFIQVRSATGQLSAGALRARASFQLFGHLLSQTARLLGQVMKIAEPFGIQLAKSLDSAATSANRWAHSMQGRNSIRQFFVDLQPTIRATGRLFVAFMGSILRQARNPGLARFFDDIRTKFLPALDQVMTAVSRGATGRALIDLLTNFATTLAKLTGPQSPAFIFLETLNGIFKVVSALPQPLTSFLFGVVAVWRAARLLGLVKLGRWFSDIGGFSDRVAKGTARLDQAMVSVANKTDANAEKMTTRIQRVILEYQRLGEQATKTAAQVATASAEMASAATKGIATGVRPVPIGVPGAKGTIVGNPGANMGPILGGNATRADYRRFLRAHGYQQVEGQALSRARLATVKAEAERLIMATAVGGFLQGVGKAEAAVARKPVMGAGAVRGGWRPPSGWQYPAGWTPPGVRAYDRYVGPMMQPGGFFGDVRAGYRAGGLRGAGSALSGQLRGGAGVGLSFGLPTALLAASMFTQNKTAQKTLGLAGTGALVGGMFGPWGAAIGGLAGLALSFGRGRKSVDEMSRAFHLGSDAARRFAQAAAAGAGLAERRAQAGIGVRQARTTLRQARGAVDEFRAHGLATGLTEEQLRRTAQFRQLLDELSIAQGDYNRALKERKQVEQDEHQRQVAMARARATSIVQLNKMIGQMSHQITLNDQLEGRTKSSEIERAASRFMSFASNLQHNGMPIIARTAAAYSSLLKELGRVPKPKEIKIRLRLDSTSIELIKALRRSGFTKESNELSIGLHQHGFGAGFRRAGGFFAGRRQGGGFFIPGQRVAADNVMIMGSPGELVVTEHGQQMMEQEAPGLVQRVAQRQMPHFRAGGLVRGFATGGEIPAPVFPGSSAAGAQGAFESGAGAGGRGALSSFIQGLISGGAFDTDSGTDNLLSLEGVPRAQRFGLRSMIRRARQIARSGRWIAEQGIIGPLRTRSSGEIRGLVGDRQLPGWGWTLASAITGILRAGGIGTAIKAKTAGLRGLAPLTGRGRWLTLHTKPQIGGAMGAALQILRGAFGQRARGDAATGAGTGLGWLGSVPSGMNRGHWAKFRRGGMVGGFRRRFAAGGIIGQVNTPGTSGQFGMIQLGQMLQRASFGLILTLIHQFEAIISLVQTRLNSALRAGRIGLANRLSKQLGRLEAGLQAVEFAAGQRVNRVTVQVESIMARMGRIDATTIANIRKQQRLTTRAMGLITKAIHMATAAGAAPDFIKSLRDQLQAIRDSRRDQVRAISATRVAISDFRLQRQQLGLQRLEIQQRLAGTFDTGGAQRAAFIRKNIIPALQNELRELQKQLKKGKLTGEERRQQQLAIDQKRNEILQASLDAQEAIQSNTAKLVQNLSSPLSFEFGGQSFTDLVGSGTGV